MDTMSLSHNLTCFILGDWILLMESVSCHAWILLEQVYVADLAAGLRLMAESYSAMKTIASGDVWI